MKRLISLLALASALACVTAQAADVKGDVKAGEKKVAMCLGCHNIIGDHPEYHALLETGEAAMGRDWTPEQGETNPFLHLSLHLAIAEQLSIDQPPGISGYWL